MNLSTDGIIICNISNDVDTKGTNSTSSTWKPAIQGKSDAEFFK